MIVGIMSMQRVRNYGSFLQAFGLKKIIESMGHTVKFVDYKAEVPLTGNDVGEKNENIILRIMRMLSPNYRAYRKKQIKLNSTFTNFCNTYDREFLPELGVGKEYVYTPKVDVLIIGSDEVFNCTQKGKQVGYSLQLFGKDNQANSLISYAASFGNTTLEKLNKYNVTAEIAYALKQFNDISVRDQNSADIIEKLCGFKPKRHIDPVLLYDFPEVDNIHICLKDYIVVYAYADRIHCYGRDRHQKNALFPLLSLSVKKLVAKGRKEECRCRFLSPFSNRVPHTYHDICSLSASRQHSVWNSRRNKCQAPGTQCSHTNDNAFPQAPNCDEPPCGASSGKMVCYLCPRGCQATPRNTPLSNPSHSHNAL